MCDRRMKIQPEKIERGKKRQQFLEVKHTKFLFLAFEVLLLRSMFVDWWLLRYNVEIIYVYAILSQMINTICFSFPVTIFVATTIIAADNCFFLLLLFLFPNRTEPDRF